MFFTSRDLFCGVLLVCACALSYWRFGRGYGNVFVRRWQSRHMRSLSTDTILVEEKTPDSDGFKTESYVATFPPLQRDKLAKLASTMTNDQREQLGNLNFDSLAFQKSILGFEEDFTKASPSSHCYSGFSVKEIRALGDFPNYAALSGVPLPDPYEHFDIRTALPRPYRPFRWAYHQTMSLTRLETDWWLELESTYMSRIAQRKILYKEHGPAVLQWLPGSELACKELMEMVLQFLCARYPQYFELEHASENPRRSVFTNKILGTRQIVQDQHPLLILLDNVPEDFALMIRNPDTGYYHFRAGMICSALGWTLGTKIGKRLHEIHDPVPDYHEKMRFSMDRFFSKMPTSKPIQRGSWGLEVDQPLYMPPGDPHEKYRDFQLPEMALKRINLRVDWQTLRRLPLSGAICFNFKAVFTPITEFRDEPKIPSLILKVLKDGKENLMKYKNCWHVEHVAKPALQTWEREQKESGLCEEGWEPKTLEQSPFFEDWETKWHGQQGF